MSEPAPATRPVFGVVLDVAASPALRQALTVVIFGLSLATPFFRVVMGWPGVVAAVAVIVVAASVSLRLDGVRSSGEASCRSPCWRSWHG